MTDRIEITLEHHASLWYDALRTEHGLRLHTEDVEAARDLEKKMQVARKDLADPRLSVLHIRILESGTELWVYRNPNAQLP